MNGSGHLQEDFRQSMFLCPVDLKKLSALFEFDILDRYEKLMEFYIKYNFSSEVKALEKMIAQIKPNKRMFAIN